MSSKYSRLTKNANHTRPLERHYGEYQPEQSESRERQNSGAIDSEQLQPRRRRWAAGYINSRSCPSYAYIESRSRLSDDQGPSNAEYIEPWANRDDDYIEGRGHPRSSESYSRTRTEKETSRSRRTGGFEGHVGAHGTKIIYGSDVEEISDHSWDPRIYPIQRSTSSDIDEGKAIDIIDTARDLGSDVASVCSMQSSRSQSDRDFVKLRNLASEERTMDISGSDSDGDYISLDDYIAGRSDCVSVRMLSEDDGEGSDAVGSDIELRSDVGDGGDVASDPDYERYNYEDDCIESYSDDYCGSREEY
ncbi:hypothetical protein E8E13_001445 [Curvularia kusanoi]|uniref:Uncharacterized protein n=1 Tax=Curvularia kusanoi TaxID=90978 RepID=A0A9P4W905_CURKU|nr:hypothetical protein E8E13_001445 [Curvularia kusanoi]